MKSYILVESSGNIQSGAIIENSLTNPIDSDSSYRWLELKDDPIPSYDEQKQMLSASFFIDDNIVNRSWQVVDLSNMDLAFAPYLQHQNIVITSAQFKIALRKHGFRADIESALNQLGFEDFKDMYEFSDKFHLHDPRVIQIALYKNITSSQVLDVFTSGEIIF